MENLSIHEPISRYYHFEDTQNKEAWLNLWVQEGHLQNGDSIAKGKRQLGRFADDHITYPSKQTRHIATNFFVVANGEQGTAVNYMLVIDSIVQEAQWATAICYSMLDKVNGEWKWRLHIFTTDQSFDFSKLK